MQVATDEKISREFRPLIYVFVCENSCSGVESSFKVAAAEIKEIKLPCSGKVTELYLLKALEAGADGVLVLACPEKECRHLQGNLRAGRRVEELKQLLDEIGVNGSRLSLQNLSRQTDAAAMQIKEFAQTVRALGPSPARPVKK